MKKLELPSGGFAGVLLAVFTCLTTLSIVSWLVASVVNATLKC